MADIQPTDQFLVNRYNSTQTVNHADLMASLQDTDLMLINRSDQTYTITGEDLKDSLKPPLTLSVVLSTNDPSVAEEITATGVAGGGTPPFTYAYQWQKGSVDIAGATAQVYTPVLADVGSKLKCVVTATDADGDDITAESPETNAVEEPNEPPSVSGAALAGGPRFSDQTYTTTLQGYDPGTPEATLGMKARVTGALSTPGETSAIVSSDYSLIPGGDINAPTTGTDTYNFYGFLKAQDVTHITGIRLSGPPNPTGDVSAVNTAAIDDLRIDNFYFKGSNISYEVTGNYYFNEDFSYEKWIDGTSLRSPQGSSQNYDITFDPVAIDGVESVVEFSGYILYGDPKDLDTYRIWVRDQDNTWIQVIGNPIPRTDLILTDDTNLRNGAFLIGDSVYQSNNSATTGTVFEIDADVPSMVLSPSTPDWTVGERVINTVANPLIIKPITSEITGVATDSGNLIITLTDDTDLGQFVASDDVYQDGGYTPETSAITNVTETVLKWQTSMTNGYTFSENDTVASQSGSGYGYIGLLESDGIIARGSKKTFTFTESQTSSFVFSTVSSFPSSGNNRGCIDGTGNGFRLSSSKVNWYGGASSSDTVLTAQANDTLTITIDRTESDTQVWTIERKKVGDTFTHTFTDTDPDPVYMAYSHNNGAGATCKVYGSVSLTLTDDTDLENFRVGDTLPGGIGLGISVIDNAGNPLTTALAANTILRVPKDSTYDITIFEETITVPSAGELKLQSLSSSVGCEYTILKLVGGTTSDDSTGNIGPGGIKDFTFNFTEKGYVVIKYGYPGSIQSSGGHILHYANVPGQCSFNGVDMVFAGENQNVQINLEGSDTGPVNTLTAIGPGNTLTVDGGTWSVGDVVTGPATTPATGIVDSTDPSSNTMTLSTSDETPPKRWISNGNRKVTMDEKPAVQTTSYLEFSGTQVTGLTSADPGYKPADPSLQLTFTDPAPTGESWDDELPAGTSMQTRVLATNSSGTADTGWSNSVVGRSLSPDADMQAAYLETQARLLTHSNRAAIHQGQLAQEAREEARAEIAEDMGITVEELDDLVDGNF